MKQEMIVGLSVIFMATLSWAAPIEFDFKDPKGVNNAVFKTDAPLESINGTATGISGKVTFDPQNPSAVKGKIIVAASSLHVPNSQMQEHLRGKDWLDVAQHADITFEIASAKNLKMDANNTTADVTGKFTLKGVTKEITVPVKMTFLKDKLKDRSFVDGDLLVVRTHFTIKRSDYGVNAAKFEDKVSDEIELTLNLAGAAPRK